MPKRKIQRTLEEEEEFQRQRRERKAVNQHHRHQIAKISNNTLKSITYKNNSICVAGTICGNRIKELNDNVEEHSSDNILLHQQVACTSQTIHDNRIMESDEEIIGQNSESIISIYKQRFVENQSRYRSRQKNQPRLNISNTISVNDVTEYYIGPMDVYCVHCNAKHFAAEKISNKGNSFHDCCNHGTVYLQPLPEHPQFLHSLFAGTHVKSNNFFQYIRSYNSSFSFASFRILKKYNLRMLSTYSRQIGYILDFLLFTLKKQINNPVFFPF